MSDKVKVTIWGRELELGITYDCYSGENVLDSQKDAVNSLLTSSNVIESVLDDVKKYCLTNNGKEIGTDTIENIFKYVAPKYLFVPRDSNKHVVAIMCNYRFNQEQGIAIVFENEKFSRIGNQDIIL